MSALPACRTERCLVPPPGAPRVPRFDAGWETETHVRRAYLSYIDEDPVVDDADSLEHLHEEASRTHCMDVLTRRIMLACLGALSHGSTVIDVGCSAGYLLEDLHEHAPSATLIGVDLLGSGLDKAHAIVPEAMLLQADACALPLDDLSVDAAVSANVLEHVRDDKRALAEIHRVLRPGARAVIVVPLGPGNYDYYDRFVGHQRRYARGELAHKALGVGLQALDEVCLGALLYPAFWMVKQRNRRRHAHLRGEALARRAVHDVERTKDSVIGRLACRLEERLIRGGIRLPYGIRGLVVLARPEEDDRGRE